MICPIKQPEENNEKIFVKFVSFVCVRYVCYLSVLPFPLAGFSPASSQSPKTELICYYVGDGLVRADPLILTHDNWDRPQQNMDGCILIWFLHLI